MGEYDQTRCVRWGDKAELPIYNNLWDASNTNDVELGDTAMDKD